MTTKEYLKEWDCEYLQEGIVINAINKIKDIFKAKTKRLRAIAADSEEWGEIQKYVSEKEDIWQAMFTVIRIKLSEKIQNKELTLAEANKELMRINREIHEEVESEWADAEAAFQAKDDDCLKKVKKFYEKLLKITAAKLKKEFNVKVKLIEMN